MVLVLWSTSITAKWRLPPKCEFRRPFSTGMAIFIVIFFVRFKKAVKCSGRGDLLYALISCLMMCRTVVVVFALSLRLNCGHRAGNYECPDKFCCHIHRSFLSLF